MPSLLPSPLGALLRALLPLIVLAIPLRADEAAMQEVGINSHLLRYDDYAAACDEIIASGVKWIRINVEWGILQPAAGALPATANATQLARLDYVVNHLHDNGVGILFVLAYGTDWCSSAPSSTTSGRRFYPPTDPAGLTYWENYVEFLANRYSGKIFNWEVWNEPDSSIFLRVSGTQTRVGEYYKLLSKAASKIHAANAANQVLLGGLVMPATNPQASDPNAPYMQVDFLDQLLTAGGNAWFDLMNYHAYGDPASQLAKYQSVQSVLASHNLSSKKIWLTETGYTTAGDTSLEAMKADRITQHRLANMSFNNVDRIFWYVDRNVDNTTLIEGNFGLRAADRTPLMPFYSYQALDGAGVDFHLQTLFPSQSPTQRTVTYLSPATGNGSGITSYATDGSSKRIPANNYMYFQVNDQWLYDANGGLDGTVYVDVTYLNNAPSGMTAGVIMQYDSQSAGTYAQLPLVYRNDSGTWATCTFQLDAVAFKNRQNNGADFRISAGALQDLILGSVVVRKKADSARLKFGPTDRYFLMDRQDGQLTTDASYNPAVTYNGETCRQILNTGKYIFLRVSDAIVRRGDTHLRIKLRFWDDAGGNIVIQYNAVDGSTVKNAVIGKTGTNAWRDAIVEITDADFRNASNWFTDLRLYTGSDNSVEYVSSIEITPLPLFADDFQDGNSTGWTTTGGTWAVTAESTNQVLKQNAAAGETIAVTGQPTWNDYDYAADLKLYNASAAGILARYTDANNYYVFAFSTGLDRIYLKKRVAGVTTSLVDLPWDFTTGTRYRLRLVLNGTRITAFVDGVQAASIYDSSLSTGRVGARAVDGIYSFDNVDVR